MKGDQQQHLPITGLGLVSSVGHDVATACASIRAGISRPAEVGPPLMSDSGADPVYLTGHPVRPVTDGFCFLGRWLRLAKACFDDLRDDARLPPPADRAFWERTGLVLPVPEAQDRVYEEVAIDDDYLMQRYARPLLRLANAPVALSNLSLVMAGHCGAVAGVERASEMLGARSVDRVIVLAVDSWVEAGSLEWLAARRRIKTEDNPVGLAPGEAGAAFLLEAASAAKRRGIEPHAFVLGVESARDPEFEDKRGGSHGRALGTLLRGTTRIASQEALFAGDVIADLNGEPARAYEYGMARTMLTDTWSDDVNLVIPAVSLGDTGAASGAIGVCIAVRSLLRNYARASSSLVASRSDDGLVGAVLLGRVD